MKKVNLLHRKVYLNKNEKVIWPKTVEEAVDNILSSMSDENKLRVKNTRRDDLGDYHSTWGMGIRNDFGLWAGNRRLLWSCAYNDFRHHIPTYGFFNALLIGFGGAYRSLGRRPIHPDDASWVIIKAVWEKLQS